MSGRFRTAPPLETSSWLNVPAPLAPDALRGSIVALYAFQITCPGCTELALPQAQRLHELFAARGVAVLGLHTVFESHEAQGGDALARFVSERRLTFPIAVDASDGERIPRTMRALNLDGTPSVTLLDGLGRIRMKRLGHVPDLELGAQIGALLQERPAAP